MAFYKKAVTVMWVKVFGSNIWLRLAEVQKKKLDVSTDPAGIVENCGRKLGRS